MPFCAMFEAKTFSVPPADSGSARTPDDSKAILPGSVSSPTLQSAAMIEKVVALGGYTCAARMTM